MGPHLDYCDVRLLQCNGLLRWVFTARTLLGRNITLAQSANLDRRMATGSSKPSKLTLDQHIRNRDHI